MKAHNGDTGIPMEWQRVLNTVQMGLICTQHMRQLTGAVHGSWWSSTVDAAWWTEKTLADVTAQLSPFRKPSKSSRFSTQLGVLSWFIMIPSLVLGWFRLVVNSFAVSQVGSANRQLYAGSIPAYVIPMCPNLPWGSLPFFSGASVAKITQD